MSRIGTIIALAETLAGDLGDEALARLERAAALHGAAGQDDDAAFWGAVASAVRDLAAPRRLRRADAEPAPEPVAIYRCC